MQYLSDNNGKTTGVFIPIDEWNLLKSKFKGLESEEPEIPEWHKNIIQERISEYERNPQNSQNFDDFMDNLEKNL